MFSFHKPKVYRSSTGCCICRAKSSSSRFTDSKKYEDDFIECFQLEERRAGEICNACVLLVKRWKKLPAGSERNWRHVVDARAGPGTKSLSKFKSLKSKKKPKLRADLVMKSPRSEDQETATVSSSAPAKRRKHIYRKQTPTSTASLLLQAPGRLREASPGALSDDIPGDECLSGGSDLEDMEEEDMTLDLSQPASPTPSLDNNRAKSPQTSSFLDLTFWKREVTCCGTVFKGRHGEVLIDMRLLKPCGGCPLFKSPAPSRPASPTSQPGVKNNAVTTLLAAASKDSDSSSDSGYDESSNPSSLAAKAAASAAAATVSQVEAANQSRPAVIQSPRSSKPTVAVDN